MADETTSTPDTDGLPPLPPGYVWARPIPAPAPPDPWKAPRWLKVLAVAWAVGLVVAGLIWQFHGRQTVREQTTIAAARPVVDTAIHDVLVAAGTGPVAVVSDFHDTGSCDITPVRRGAQYQRALDLYTAPGTEAALLNSIVTGLPARYRAASDHGTVLGLEGDAGDFVAVIGTVPAPGHVEFRALTGCRPVGDLVVPAAVPATGPAAAAVAGALDTLRLPATPATIGAELSCGADGVRTASATVPNAGSASLGTLSAAPVYGSANAIAYRDNGVDVVARRQGDALIVSATTRC